MTEDPRNDLTAALDDLAEQAGPPPTGLAAGARRRAAVQRRRRTAVLSVTSVLAVALVSLAVVTGNRFTDRITPARPTAAPIVGPFSYVAPAEVGGEAARVAWTGYSNVRVLYAHAYGKWRLVMMAGRKAGHDYLAVFSEPAQVGAGGKARLVGEYPLEDPRRPVAAGFLLAKSHPGDGPDGVLLAPCQPTANAKRVLSLRVRPEGPESDLAGAPAARGVWILPAAGVPASSVTATCRDGSSQPFSSELAVAPVKTWEWGSLTVLLPPSPSRDFETPQPSPSYRTTAAR